MRLKLLSVASALVAMTAAPAFADSIDFAQFGPEFTTVASGATGLTNGGVTFTIFSPNGSFEELKEGSSWAGEFAHGETILFDNFGPGVVEIDFATAITSILHLEAQANFFGAYTATLTGFDGATNLGSVSDSSDNEGGPEATIPFLNFPRHISPGSSSARLDDGVGLALEGPAALANGPPGVRTGRVGLDADRLWRPGRHAALASPPGARYRLTPRTH